MTPRDARGRFARPAEPPARPWTILATDRSRAEVHAVNRRRDRLTSRTPGTAIRFETQAEADRYLARMPPNP